LLKRVLRVLALGLALNATGGIRATAAQPATPPAAKPPAATDGFVPVTDLPPAEQLPAAPLVLAAYAFIWVAVLVYVALLWRRLAAVQKDLDALKHTPPR
jgi:CcmD family protein